MIVTAIAKVRLSVFATWQPESAVYVWHWFWSCKTWWNWEEGHVWLNLIRNNQAQFKGSRLYCDHGECDSGQLCADQCLQLGLILTSPACCNVFTVKFWGEGSLMQLDWQYLNANHEMKILMWPHGERDSSWVAAAGCVCNSGTQRRGQLRLD